MSKKERKKFKDTGLGQFLGKVKDHAGIVIDVGLDIAGGNFKDALNTVRDELEQRRHTDEKAATMYYEFQAKYLDFQKEMQALEVEYQKEISRRWESDNQGSWLSRNVRPLTLIYLTFVFSTIMVLDSIDTIAILVDDEYKSAIVAVWTTVIVAYFGARTIDKRAVK